MQVTIHDILSINRQRWSKLYINIIHQMTIFRFKDENCSDTKISKIYLKYKYISINTIYEIITPIIIYINMYI